MIHWPWLLFAIFLTAALIACLVGLLASNAASDQRDENAALKRENASLRKQLEETTALQLKLAAEKAMGGF